MTRFVSQTETTSGINTQYRTPIKEQSGDHWSLKLIKAGKFLELKKRAPLSRFTKDYIYILKDKQRVAWIPTESDMMSPEWKEVCS